MGSAPSSSAAASSVAMASSSASMARRRAAASAALSASASPSRRSNSCLAKRAAERRAAASASSWARAARKTSSSNSSLRSATRRRAWSTCMTLSLSVLPAIKTRQFSTSRRSEAGSRSLRSTSAMAVSKASMSAASMAISLRRASTIAASCASRIRFTSRCSRFRTSSTSCRASHGCARKTSSHRARWKCARAFGGTRSTAAMEETSARARPWPSPRKAHVRERRFSSASATASKAMRALLRLPFRSFSCLVLRDATSSSICSDSVESFGSARRGSERPTFSASHCASWTSPCMTSSTARPAATAVVSSARSCSASAFRSCSCSASKAMARSMTRACWSASQLI
mmetsp:Transcript_10119/g.33444  ORF Transcript_10119/g.33444 Transcript_10119/m.33444 type:complete len:345 (-) Transcript_10119:65-1099(-)